MGALNSPIAVDSMLFIYLLDSSSEFHLHTRKIFKTWEDENNQLFTSNISVLESLSTPTLTGHNEIISEYINFFTRFPNLTIYPVDLNISFKAAELRRHFSALKTPDSIQLATAIQYNAQIFVTNDNKLANVTIPFPKIIPLKDLVN